MAKSSQSVESLIKSTFALQVAVRCTEEVEMACRKNNLKFSEMLKPFCALSNNGEYTMGQCYDGKISLHSESGWLVVEALYFSQIFEPPIETRHFCL